MTTVLILPLDAPSGARLETSVSKAGYAPAFARLGESAAHALERTGARTVLLESELPVPSAFIPGARRTGATVIYYSSILSAYELASSARRRGVSHFPLDGSVQILRAMLDDSAAMRESFTQAEEVSAPVELTTARSTVGRAHALLRQSRDLIIRSAELRATQRVAIAACHRSREALRQSIIVSTAELRDAGTPYERVLALVHNSLARECAPDTLGWDEARAWIEEAYRVA